MALVFAFLEVGATGFLGRVRLNGRFMAREPCMERSLCREKQVFMVVPVSLGNLQVVISKKIDTGMWVIY